MLANENVKKNTKQGCGNVNDSSIIIDLALDHSDYYTHAELVQNARLHCDLTVDFFCHQLLDHCVFRHDLAVECFVLHWRGHAEKEKFPLDLCEQQFISAYHPSKRIHWSSQRLRDSSSWRLLRIATGRVNRTAFDEDAHEDEKRDAHQHHQIPVLNHILLQCLQCFLVEQKVLQSNEWPVSVNGATL